MYTNSFSNVHKEEAEEAEGESKIFGGQRPFLVIKRLGESKAMTVRWDCKRRSYTLHFRAPSGGHLLHLSGNLRLNGNQKWFHC